MEYIALDSHKRYSFASVEEHTGAILKEARIDHRRGAIAEFLSAWKPGTSVAVETIGNWYWIVDEIEAAGMVPQLVHARRAKMMLASVNKTDKLDCHGLNRLQRTGTLPTVWIPPATIRRPSRFAAHANGTEPRANEAEESNPCHTCQVCHLHRGGKRCLRQARAGGAGEEAGALAAAQSILRREALGDIREAPG